MSAEIVFKGNAGNHMFQYFTAIIFCVKHKINMITEPTSKMLKCVCIDNSIFSLNKVNQKITNNKKLTFRHFDDNNELFFHDHHTHYIFNI